MAKPVTPDERARIVELLHEGHTCGHIAKTVHRSNDTISRIAAAEGHRFGESNLARAHEARSAYAAEARGEVASAALERARQLLAEYEATQPVVSGTADGPVVVEVKLDARGQKDRAQAASTLMRTVLDIDRHDNAGGRDVSAMDQWLQAMTGGDS